jgi:hypothetical protein
VAGADTRSGLQAVLAPAAVDAAGHHVTRYITRCGAGADGHHSQEHHSGSSGTGSGNFDGLAGVAIGREAG